jgi:MoaA/NifB/PqqE/SkfB family radical SAM enzyme
MNTDSYTSASNLIPWKLLASNAIHNGVCHPHHIQLIPTNRCNSNCPWCSCAGVNRREELFTEELEQIIAHFRQLGCNAITWTGGGEPLLHKGMPTLLAQAKQYGIDNGLVTNGLVFDQPSFDYRFLNQTLLWMRLSINDTEGDYDYSRISGIARCLPLVDLGISFTVTANPNLTLVRNICELSAAHDNITHIRFVSDLNDPESAKMDAVASVAFNTPSVEKIIIQDRVDSEPGDPECGISKVKPLIGADGYVYPCCGVQYANTKSAKKLHESFRMCHWSDYTLATPAFDGSACDVCYYERYNFFIKHITSERQHTEHI